MLTYLSMDVTARQNNPAQKQRTQRCHAQNVQHDSTTLICQGDRFEYE
jgi:hypothetical protein